MGCRRLLPFSFSLSLTLSLTRTLSLSQLSLSPLLPLWLVFFTAKRTFMGKKKKAPPKNQPPSFPSLPVSLSPTLTGQPHA